MCLPPIVSQRQQGISLQTGASGAAGLCREADDEDSSQAGADQDGHGEHIHRRNGIRFTLRLLRVVLRKLRGFCFWGCQKFNAPEPSGGS